MARAFAMGILAQGACWLTAPLSRLRMARAFAMGILAQEHSQWGPWLENQDGQSIRNMDPGSRDLSAKDISAPPHDGQSIRNGDPGSRAFSIETSAGYVTGISARVSNANRRRRRLLGWWRRLMPVARRCHRRLPHRPSPEMWTCAANVAVCRRRRLSMAGRRHPPSWRPSQ